MKNMKRYIVEATTRFEISFDETSETFKQTLADFRESIYKGAKEIDIVQQVAHHLVHQGFDTMIEGVGYVSQEYKASEKKDPDSGVIVHTDELNYQYEVTETLPF